MSEGRGAAMSQVGEMAAGPQRGYDLAAARDKAAQAGQAVYSAHVERIRQGLVQVTMEQAGVAYPCELQGWLRHLGEPG